MNAHTSPQTSASSPPRAASGSSAGTSADTHPRREDRQLHPWPGLASYEEADQDSFFGRESESEELFLLLNRAVLAVVFGRSGDGKTSLLNAGLFPRLRPQNFLPLPVRTGQLVGEAAPEKLLAGLIQQAMAVAQVEVESLAPPLESDRETLWEHFHRLEFWDARNRPVTPVLVFDQFEEVFTLGKGATGTAALLNQLADLVENRIPGRVRAHLEERGIKLPFPAAPHPYKVMLCLREDYVPRLDDLRQRMPAVMENRFVVKPFSGEQALQAVLGPGQAVVQPAVAEQIVRFVAAAEPEAAQADARSLGELEVEPALLSVVCRELNNHRLLKGQPYITMEELQQRREVILSDLYERSFSDLDPSVRNFVEEQLITSSGNRCTLPVERATEAGLAAEVIETLIGRRLIRTENRLGIPHLELTHDLLAGMVRSSRNRRQLQEMDEEWELERQARSRKYLWRAVKTLVLLAAGVVLVFASVVEFSRLKEQRQVVQRPPARRSVPQPNTDVRALWQRGGGSVQPPQTEVSPLVHFWFRHEGPTMPGQRVWLLVDPSTWIELYPDGVQSRFRIIERTIAGQKFSGTVVQKYAGDPQKTGTANDGTFEVFIPDRANAPLILAVRRRQGGRWSEWQPLSLIHPID